MVNLEMMKLTGDGWSSESPAVDRLLKRLTRKTRSESSRRNYLMYLALLCEQQHTTPDEIVKWSKKQVEEAVQSFGDQYKNPNSANVIQGRLITFFTVNGFRVGKHSSLELETYHVVARTSEMKEYIPEAEEIKGMATKGGVGLRNRCGILLLYTGGLRNGTLRALRWDDLPDLDSCGDKPLKVPIYPEMKEVDKKAAKGNIPYYTFAAKETVEALRNYRRFVEEKYGIVPGQVIFMSTDRRIPEEDVLDSATHKVIRRGRRFTPISERMLENLVKEAAKSAGIAQWKKVKPHTLRKAYDSAIRNSGLSLKDNEFLMGHLLAGAQEHYYDRTKIEELRQKYAKIKFFEDISAEIKDELDEARREIAQLKRQHSAEGSEVAELRELIKGLTERINRMAATQS